MPRRGAVAAWSSAALAGVLLLGVLSLEPGPLSPAVLGRAPAAGADRLSSAVLAAVGPVNTVHRSRSLPVTNATGAVAFAPLLLGQTNFLNR